MKFHDSFDRVMYVEHKNRLYELDTAYRAGAWRLFVYEKGITYDNLFDDPDIEPKEIMDPDKLQLFVNSARLIIH